MALTGILLSLVALVCWGLGDFFIQKASRKVGVAHALFYNTVTIAIVLLPFVWPELRELFDSRGTMLLLAAAGAIIFLTGLLQYDALKVGKLAVVEPIISLELPLTVLFGIAIGREHLPTPYYIIIFAVFIGIMLAVMPHRAARGRVRLFEKGVLLAIAGALGMALTNFIIGYSSQETSPILTIWVTHTIIAALCFFYLTLTRQLSSLSKNFRKAPGAIILETVFDNTAWIAYAFAVTFIPISVAITISESYIILAVLLGVFINRERLRHHQTLGVILAIGGVLLLALLSTG